MMMMRSRLFLFFLFLFPTLSFSQDILSLEEAIRLGLQNSYTIQIARNNLEVARNNNTIGNAGYLPRIDLNANQGNNFQDRHTTYSDETTASQQSYPTHTLTSGASLSWTLFDGFAMFIGKEKLGVYEQQSDLQLRISIENTVADIAYTYYSIAFNQRLCKSYEDLMSLSRQRLKIAREKSIIGVGYELQELQSEVDFRADSAQYIRQKSQLVNLKAELNKLLARDPDIEFDVNTTIPVPQPLVTSSVLSKVKEGNPTILNSRMQAQVADLELREAQSARFPTVNLSGAYNFNNTNTPEGSTVLSRIYGPYVGLGASFTLFNGFNATRRINNARIVSDNQRLSQQDILVKVQSAAFKLVNNLNQAIELVKVEEKSIVLAQRNAEAAWEKYRLGAISDIELRESQNKLLDAQVRLISAQMNAQVADIDIRALTGEMAGFIENQNQ